MSDRLADLGHPLSAPALSQLESGKTRPSARSLVAIADTTGFPTPYFVRRTPGGTTEAFFRSLRSAPARDRRRSLAFAHLLRDFVEVLEHHVELPALDLPRLHGTTHSDEEIEDLAIHVRRQWGLGLEPVPDVIREIERHGAVVARFPLQRSDLDAFSVWFPDHPVVVLGQDKNVTARSRFDAAHELGHLILHGSDVANTKEAEAQAHLFAAAFLMPRQALEPVLPRTADWRVLLDLKVEWGVSMASLLYRARRLGCMTEARYVAAVRYMSTQGWRKTEPGDSQLGSCESPRLIPSALRLLSQGGVTLEELADQAGLPISVAQKFAGETSAARPRLEI